MLASGTATYIVITGALAAALLAAALVFGSGSFWQRFTILAVVPWSNLRRAGFDDTLSQWAPLQNEGRPSHAYQLTWGSIVYVPHQDCGVRA